ncbi:MAG: CPBP family intramembrane metalloprotease [Opitutaceae bacterium]|nr:CPBP family intramembrane metalloprotease [Opitutaceae bacterium]
MPTEPLQQILVLFIPQTLPAWPLTLAEFGIFIFFILGTGAFCQLAAQGIFKAIIAKSVDREGLQLCLNGFSFDGGGLLGWGLFRWIQSTWASTPPPVTPIPTLTWGKLSLAASTALLTALPLIVAANWLWTLLIEALGLPAAPQDLIAIFAQTKSPYVIAGMLIVACVLAPLYEELLFRAGLYRFCRQHLGRTTALILSGALFGAVHANWASFLPLALLGIILALIYETTGDIRAPIIAHGLFNLNTVLIVFSGLPQ